MESSASENAEIPRFFAIEPFLTDTFAHIGVKIFEHLDKQSLANSKLVCKQWLNFTESQRPLLLREIYFFRQQRIDIKDKLDQLLKKGNSSRYVKAVTLTTRILVACKCTRLGTRLLDILLKMKPKKFTQFILDLMPLKSKKLKTELKTLQLDAVIAKESKFYKMLIQLTGLFNPRNQSNGKTALRYAVESRDIDLVAYILDHINFSHNQPDHFGKTPIDKAADNVFVEAFLLLAHKLNRDPLNYAAHIKESIGFDETYELFKAIALQTKAKCIGFFRCEEGRTVLHHAVEEEDYDFVNYILKQTDVDPLQADDHGDTALELADLCDDSRAFQLITMNISEAIAQSAFLMDPEKLISWRCSKGRSILYYGVLSENLDLQHHILKTLHLLGDDSKAIELIVQKMNYTIDYASIIEDYEDGTFSNVAKKLITKNIGFIKCKLGRTLLHYAVENEDHDLIKYILENDVVDPLLADSQGDTALQLAVLWEDSTAFQLIATKIHDNPLELAVEYEQWDAFENIAFQMDHSKLRSWKCSKGKSILHYGVQSDNPYFAQYILNIAGS